MSEFVCRFLKLNENAIIPTRGEEKSIGLDLFSLGPFQIEPEEVKLVSTGLVAIPPIGFHYEILLRSSTPKKYPGLILANHVGLIDPSYCGPEDEIKMAFLNLAVFRHYVGSEKPIAQLVLRENNYAVPKEITLEEYKETCFYKKGSRGGFGSTDLKRERE
ncbi:MAG: hypothetical protein Q8P81_03200 [Nanoarchaeota archaeon]|nr:hypothetical protein [Nanoarchaeota archaeon]